MTPTTPTTPWSRKKKDAAPRGVFRHPSGAWAVRYTCGQGHVHQEKIGPLKSEAIQRYHDRRGRAHEPGWCPAVERRAARADARRERVTFEQYAADYLAWSTTVHRSRKTARGEVARLGAAWGSRPLDSITSADVEQFLTALRTGPAPLSPSTVNRYRDRVSGMFKRAIRIGLVERNPAWGIPKSKEPGGRILYLMPPEESAVRDCLPPEFRPAFTAALHTGLRWSEQAALVWRDVDVLVGSIGVGRSKNGYGRRVPINSVVRSVLVDVASRRRRVPTSRSSASPTGPSTGHSAARSCWRKPSAARPGRTPAGSTASRGTGAATRSPPAW
jgi:integrase